jgi:hypothetical protein
MRDFSVVALLVGGSLLVGCADKPQDEAALMTDTAAISAAPAAPAADTTGEALWARLQQENYTTWSLWPGKEKYYQGQEPHGALLITYVNALAQDALTNGAAQMPAGAIIVKENYGPDRQLMGATVMEKVPGYDAQNSDWFWAKYTADGTVEMSGRVAMCSACHQGAAQYDQLWTLAKDKTGKGPAPM